MHYPARQVCGHSEKRLHRKWDEQFEPAFLQRPQRSFAAQPRRVVREAIDPSATCHDGASSGLSQSPLADFKVGTGGENSELYGGKVDSV